MLTLGQTKVYCCMQFEWQSAGDEFYFLYVIAEKHPSSSLMAGLDGLGGVDSALIVDASSEATEDQVCVSFSFHAARPPIYFF